MTPTIVSNVGVGCVPWHALFHRADEIDQRWHQASTRAIADDLVPRSGCGSCRAAGQCRPRIRSAAAAAGGGGAKGCDARLPFAKGTNPPREAGSDGFTG